MSDDEPIDRSEFTAVAEVGEIAEGRGIGVEIDGIVQRGDDYYAVSNRCSHQRAPLCKAGERNTNAEHTWTESRGGINTDDCTVSCPWHLWTWDLETGENEASGQRIATFDVAVEDGTVFVRV